MLPTINIFWFRRDLRLEDNAGLSHALASGKPVLPLFIFDIDILSTLEDRDDRRVSFIHSALVMMEETLRSFGSALHVHYGKPLEVFEKLSGLYDIDTLYFNHDHEPYAMKRDAAVTDLLKKKKIRSASSKDIVLFEKGEVVKDDGTPYSVFTPYYNKWRKKLDAAHFKAYECTKHAGNYYKGAAPAWPSLESMGFIENKDIPAILLPRKKVIENYHNTRDIPSVAGTSRMGVHLRFGTISIRKLAGNAALLNEVFLKELAWREFFMQVLWHHPRIVQECYKKEYEHIEWRNDEAEFSRWCEGTTGFPMVDAGMRELAATGFMHNRVRMVTASFLVKDLLIDWRWGEAYFGRMLMDYEQSSNNGNWQWAAGCGCDAAPYFRIFNPSAQLARFDKQEAYIRKWIPEYGTADYPAPMVDHKEAAARCITAYKKGFGREEGGRT